MPLAPIGPFADGRTPVPGTPSTIEVDDVGPLNTTASDALAGRDLALSTQKFGDTSLSFAAFWSHAVRFSNGRELRPYRRRDRLRRAAQKPRNDAV